MESPDKLIRRGGSGQGRTDGCHHLARRHEFFGLQSRALAFEFVLHDARVHDKMVRRQKDGESQPYLRWLAPPVPGDTAEESPVRAPVIRADTLRPQGRAQHAKQVGQGGIGRAYMKFAATMVLYLRARRRRWPVNAS